MKSIRLNKMCLNETYNEVHIGKHLSENFPIQNGLKQEDALSPLFSKKPGGVKWDTSAVSLC
jgi:hypothetical protein